MEDESKFLELRKFPDGVAMIMALIFYLGVNDYDDLYINTVSGTGEKNAREDYFVEIVYGDYKKFQTIKK